MIVGVGKSEIYSAGQQAETQIRGNLVAVGMNSKSQQAGNLCGLCNDVAVSEFLLLWETSIFTLKALN